MKPLRRFEDLVIQEVEDEVLVYDTKTAKAFCLNTTAAKVWSQCDGKISVEEMAKRLPIDASGETKLVLAQSAIRQLAENRLLQESGKVIDSTESHSRREMLKRVGTLSAVALPIVSALLVPTAAAAQSVSCGPTQGLGCACTEKISLTQTTCASGGCGAGCTCTQPVGGWIGCNPGGHFCNGTCQ